MKGSRRDIETLGPDDTLILAGHDGPTAGIDVHSLDAVLTWGPSAGPSALILARLAATDTPQAWTAEELAELIGARRSVARLRHTLERAARFGLLDVERVGDELLTLDGLRRLPRTTGRQR